MRVSFVVPTYRRPDALKQTLAALLDLDWPAEGYEVIVVDDGSGDSTAAVVAELARHDPRINYHRQANSGVATARNNGAKLAAGELLIFLDDDMLVERDHIRAQLAVTERYGDCLVNGHWVFSAATHAALAKTAFGRYRIALEDEIRERFPMTPLGDGRFQTTQVTAADLAVPAHIFSALGGFDERFPYAGYEDQEFCHRAHSAGYRLIYDPAIRLQHNDGRVTLEQFARRYQRGAVTAVYLAAIHPQEHAGTRLLLENAPVTQYDAPKLRIRKRLKQLLSHVRGERLLGVVIRGLERIAPQTHLLPKLYSATIGIFIFRGIREGLERLPEARAAVVEAMRMSRADA